MSKTILLADDSVTIQKVIELTFMDQDYDLDAVSNGDDALERLGQSSPDFVIADVHMPGASGYEVARRSKERYPEVPVLLLVGTFEPFDEGEFRSSGADQTLKKPFDSQELLRIVGELSPSASSETEVEAAPASSGPALGGEMPAESVAPPADSDSGADAWTTTPFNLRAEPAAEAATEPSEEVVAEPASDIWAAEPEDVVESESAVTPPVEVVAEPVVAEEPLQAVAEPAAVDLPEFAPIAVEPSAVEAPKMEETAAELIPEQEVAVDEADAVGELESAELASPEVASPEPEAPEPEAPEPEAPEPIATEVTPSAAFSGGLSEDDVERIARRVVEKLSEKMTREIAWEVIPDLAEVVIKDRLRELESQVE
ncbi:MAG: response regulator [Deltaproteobacteria bacterium]|nr:response regulator [Deltaproteobacteria bacterium]